MTIEKKSARQLDAEIADFLANGGTSGGSQSAMGRSWNSPDGVRRVVAEQSGRLVIKTEGQPFSELLAPSDLKKHRFAATRPTRSAGADARLPKQPPGRPRLRALPSAPTTTGSLPPCRPWLVSAR